MVGLLLDALDVLLVSYVAGQQPSAGDVQRLTEHSALWRQHLEKRRSRPSRSSLRRGRSDAEQRLVGQATIDAVKLQRRRYDSAEPSGWNPYASDLRLCL